jgi:hypothetical protein
VLDAELDSWVLAVVLVTFGVLVTCGVIFGTWGEDFAAPVRCFAACVAALPTPLAGFAGCGADPAPLPGFAGCGADPAAPPNRFPASPAPAAAAGARRSRDSVNAAHARAGIRDALIGVVDGRIELIPQRRA